MASNMTIAVSIKDNFSTPLNKMSNSSIRFNKSLKEMQVQLNTINKKHVTLKLDTGAAQRSLESLQQKYQEAQNSVSSVTSARLLRRMQTTNVAYEQGRRNLSSLNQTAQSTERSIINAHGAFARLENRADAGADGGMRNAFNDSGLTDMAKELGIKMAKAYVTSAFGSEAGTIVSSGISGALSGASAGAALGTALAPGVGTAIGAVVGTGIGVANGYLEVAQNREQAFIDVVKNQYNTVTHDRDAMLENGLAIAKQREVDLTQFSKLLGNKGAAQDYLKWVKYAATTTTFSYDDLISLSKTLNSYGYSPGKMQKRLIQIGNTGAALGMSTSDIGEVTSGLGEMESSDTVTMDHLNLLTKHNIPAIDYLAAAMGATNDIVTEMVSKGLVPGAQAAEVIANAMGRTNVGAMNTMTHTLAGLESIKAKREDEIEGAAAEQYAGTRKGGLEQQIAFLDLNSETGKGLQEAYGMRMKHKAELENQEETSWRNTMEAVLTGNISDEFSDESKINRLQDLHNRYLEAKQTGNNALMDEVITEAENEADVSYHDSDAYQKYEDTEKNIVKHLRIALVDDYRSFGYDMGLEFTKGLAAGLKDNMLSLQKGAAASLESMVERDRKGELTEEEVKIVYPGTTFEEYKKLRADSAADSYAYGLNYVPYDNFPTLLHEGERVLTASEARALKTNTGMTVTVTGNSFSVREEADIYKIAQQIAKELGNAQMIS